MREYIGIDIGGTKFAVVRGDESGRILEKRSFPTTDRANTLEQIFEHTRQILSDRTKAIGVSCGGPLDSKTGVILGPPNLPGWDCVPVTEHLTERFHLPAYLENDANACAVAEWRFGAGKGCENLILDGKLYRGACGMAGEVGHVRLFPEGHIGYGKAGSYEGYCSGGGIAQYGLGSARELADKARAGDPRALAVWEQTGGNLGRLLAILMDILNPDVIVIGSIYARAGDLMRDACEQILAAEVLEPSLRACKVVPALLGESLGDVAALSVAMGIQG